MRRQRVWAFKFGLLAGFDQVFAFGEQAPQTPFRALPHSLTHSPTRLVGQVLLQRMQHQLPSLLALAPSGSSTTATTATPSPSPPPIYDGTPNPPAGLLWSALWIGAKTRCNQHRNTRVLPRLALAGCGTGPGLLGLLLAWLGPSGQHWGLGRRQLWIGTLTSSRARTGAYSRKTDHCGHTSIQI